MPAFMSRVLLACANRVPVSGTPPAAGTVAGFDDGEGEGSGKDGGGKEGGGGGESGGDEGKGVAAASGAGGGGRVSGTRPSTSCGR